MGASFSPPHALFLLLFLLILLLFAVLLLHLLLAGEQLDGIRRML
jgi:hypothetical protein